MNQHILGVIVVEHNRDQALIDWLMERFDRAVFGIEAACTDIAQKHADRLAVSMEHKQ